MKKVLFATTAAAALAVGGAASAQGISLFGEARLGLGYNIFADGDLRAVDDDGDDIDDPEVDDDVTAISRVRWGVNMTGETDSGITFGATARADNAIGAAADSDIDAFDDVGQTEGSVFVSGAFGTLTYGDTNAADEQHVGDLFGDYSLTGLGEGDETLFFSNEEDEFRPVVRYDYDIAGFGLSASTSRELNDWGVGASYSMDFGPGSFTGGVGYNNFEEQDFTIANIGLLEPFRFQQNSGDQISATLAGTFAAFEANVIYSMLDFDDFDGIDGTGGELDTLGAGVSTTFGAFTVGAYYRTVLDSSDAFEDLDGNDEYALTGQYDLGGGASVNAGVAQVVSNVEGDDPGDFDDYIVADFGIKMAF